MSAFRSFCLRARIGPFTQLSDPEFAAQLADALQLLLRVPDASGDPELRTVALLKTEGFDNPEIATQVSCVRRTVDRKLLLINSL